VAANLIVDIEDVVVVFCINKLNNKYSTYRYRINAKMMILYHSKSRLTTCFPYTVRKKGLKRGRYLNPRADVRYPGWENAYPYIYTLGKGRKG